MSAMRYYYKCIEILERRNGQVTQQEVAEEMKRESEQFSDIIQNMTCIQRAFLLGIAQGLALNAKVLDGQPVSA